VGAKALEGGTMKKLNLLMWRLRDAIRILKNDVLVLNENQHADQLRSAWVQLGRDSIGQ